MGHDNAHRAIRPKSRQMLIGVDGVVAIVEALQPVIVELEVPVLAFRWLESLDYRYYTIHTNKHLATYRPDGSVRIVVAHEDPGVPNWLDTEGRDNGIVYWRFLMPEGEMAPMQTRVVKLSELQRSG